MYDAGTEILETCIAAGGVLSGEHGVGLEKRDLMPLMFTPEDLAAQAWMRDAFDPDGAANPGKVLPRGSRCGEIARVPEGTWVPTWTVSNADVERSRPSSRRPAPSCRSVRARTARSVGRCPSASRSAPAGIVAYDPAELTVTVGAGTSVAELREALGAAGQECPLDPRDDAATVGGVIAAGLSGHRRLRYGPVRDARARGAARDRRRQPRARRRAGGEERHRLRPAPPDRGIARHPRGDRAGDPAVPPRPATSAWATVDAPPEFVRARVFAPSTLLWDGARTQLLLEGDGRDVDLQLAAVGTGSTAAVRHHGPAWPDGPHRGRISVRPGAIVELGVALDAIAGAAGSPKAGVGTVHVATDTADALTERAAAPTRPAAGSSREAGGGDGFDGFGRDLPDRAIARRLEGRVRPHRQARTGPVPDYDADHRPRRRARSRRGRAGLVRRVRLCLPHCPTYRVTGLEAASPRGRIAAMRAVELHGAPIDATFLRVIDECVQCRGCEAACPSSVPFGHLMEGTRAALASQPATATTGGPSTPAYRRIGEWLAYRVVLARHRVLMALTWLAWLAQRLRLLPANVGVPPLRARELARALEIPRGGSPDAWVFTGCVMDAWMRDTHRAAATVLAATGLSCARPGRVAIAAARCTCTRVASTMPAGSRAG